MAKSLESSIAQNNVELIVRNPFISECCLWIFIFHNWIFSWQSEAWSECELLYVLHVNTRFVFVEPQAVTKQNNAIHILKDECLQYDSYYVLRKYVNEYLIIHQLIVCTPTQLGLNILIRFNVIRIYPFPDEKQYSKRFRRLFNGFSM